MITKTLTRNFEVVWSKDPSLDRECPDFAEKWAAYQDALDPKTLPIKDGAKVARFACAPLTMTAYQRVFSEVSEFSRCVEAVRYGLRSVEGVVVDGVQVQVRSDDKKRDGRDECLTDAFLEKIWDPHLFSELGLAIVKQSQLDPTRAQG